MIDEVAEYILAQAPYLARFQRYTTSDTAFGGPVRCTVSDRPLGGPGFEKKGLDYRARRLEGD